MNTYYFKNTLFITECDPDDPSGTEIPVSDDISIKYFDKIRFAIKHNNLQSGDTGLLVYIPRSANPWSKKIQSIKPDVMYKNNQIFGLTIVKTTEPLTNEEHKKLLFFLMVQYGHNWGKSFENIDIKISRKAKPIHVAFWNNDHGEITRMTKKELTEYGF